MIYGQKTSDFCGAGTGSVKFACSLHDLTLLRTRNYENETDLRIQIYQADPDPSALMLQGPFFQHSATFLIQLHSFLSFLGITVQRYPSFSRILTFSCRNLCCLHLLRSLFRIVLAFIYVLFFHFCLLSTFLILTRSSLAYI